MQTIKIVI